MSALIASHTLFGVFALAAGAAVLFRPKATTLHRRLGYAYVIALSVLCVESFWIRDSTPFFRGFGMFHVFAVVSLVTVLVGLVPARRRRPGWFEWHYATMAWSYIGLVMATGSHFFRPVFLFLFRDVGLSALASQVLTGALMWALPPLVGVLVLRRYERSFRRQAAPVIGVEEHSATA